MKKTISLILVMVFILSVLMLLGCGISRDVYDQAVADKAVAEANLTQAQDKILLLEADLETKITEIDSLQSQLDSIKLPGYFENRTTIENWLDNVNYLGVSEDVEQWYQYALYYQQKALESGYIISVSFQTGDDGATITCDIVTQNGLLFYFDPDNCILEDTGTRIEIKTISQLEGNLAKYSSQLFNR